MNQPWSVVLCLGLLAFATHVIGQDTEFLTLGCLTGYENDDNPQICAEVAPETKSDVAEAHRKWLTRNANALRELQDACRARLLRAYGDEKSIREAKEQAALWVVKYRRPFARQIVNCRAYAKDFAEGGPRVDIPPELPRATRETQASKVQWVNGIPQVGTPARPR
jgi:hypothetical protein